MKNDFMKLSVAINPITYEKINIIKIRVPDLEDRKCAYEFFKHNIREPIGYGSYNIALGDANCFEFKNWLLHSVCKGYFKIKSLEDEDIKILWDMIVSDYDHNMNMLKETFTDEQIEKN